MSDQVCVMATVPELATVQVKLAGEPKTSEGVDVARSEVTRSAAGVGSSVKGALTAMSSV